MSTRKADPRTAYIMLRHWREAVPNDRIEHLIKDSSRGLQRALQTRLAKRNVSFGHWGFFRFLWVRDGITHRVIEQLQELDFVDVGELIEPPGVVPVVINSLLFS